MLHPAWHFTWCTLLISKIHKVTIYILDTFLSQFWISLLLVMFSSNCCFLSYIQVSQEAGRVVWYSHLFKNFPHFAVIHTVKGFSVVSEAEVDVFWNPLAFSMIQRILTIWSLAPLPFPNPASMSGSSWFTSCWSLPWRILCITFCLTGRASISNDEKFWK